MQPFAALAKQGQSDVQVNVAGGGVSPLANGLATAADWMSAASFISMAGLISFLGYDGSVYLMGWTGGYVLLAMLLAPYLRKFGKFTVPEFIGDRYYSQTARIVAVMQTGPAPTIGFQFTGEPVSAESREWFRVSTVMAGLTTDFGPEAGCPLLDVSSVGFAVEATQAYKVGDVVTATLRYQSGTGRRIGLRRLLDRRGVGNDPHRQW